MLSFRLKNHSKPAAAEAPTTQLTRSERLVEVCVVESYGEVKERYASNKYRYRDQ